MVAHPTPVTQEIFKATTVSKGIQGEALTGVVPTGDLIPTEGKERNCAMLTMGWTKRMPLAHAMIVLSPTSAGNVMAHMLVSIAQKARVPACSCM